MLGISWYLWDLILSSICTHAFLSLPPLVLRKVSQLNLEFSMKTERKELRNSAEECKRKDKKKIRELWDLSLKIQALNMGN